MTNVAFLKQVFPQAKVTMVPGNEHVLPVTVPELIDEAVFEIMGNVLGQVKTAGADLRTIRTNFKMF